MPRDYYQIKEDIQAAIASLSPHEIPNISKLAREFNVPRKRLGARLKGRATRGERPPTNQRMTDAQILALELYVARLDAIGQPPLISQLRAAAESIRSLITPKPERALLTSLGRDFFTRFVDIHPQFSKVKQKPQEKDRVFAEERDVYTQHFTSLQDVMEKLAVCKEDVWNIDECDFRIGIGGEQEVITLETYKAAESPSETNRDFITMIEAISAGGGTIPPLAILRGARILHSHVSQELDLDPSMLLGVSESGYSNDELALEYLKHFNKWTAKQQVSKWRLLIFDGHGSHMTYEFITYCFENLIWPYALPPHTSQNLQPLDVVVFQPCKYYHKARVEQHVRLGGSDFNKIEFLHAIKTLRKDAFKTSTIISAFKQSGIWPLDAQVVLAKLRTIDRPVTPPVDEPSYPTTPQTPVTTAEIIEFTRYYLQGIDPFTGDEGLLEHRVTKLAKGAVAVSAAYETQAQELHKLTAASQHRNKRQIQDKRVIQSGGTVTVNDARLRVAKRAVADKKKGVVHKSAREMAVLMAQEEAGPSRSTPTL